MQPNKPFSCPRRTGASSGLSYIEVVISITILSILVVAAMQLFANLGRYKSALLNQDDGGYLAMEMIREIMQKSYRDPNNANEFGIGTAEVTTGRLLMDDIDDYHNWTQSPPQNRTGDPLTQYDHLTRTVQVRHVQADDFSITALADEGFKEVTITIKNKETPLTQQVYVIPDVDLDKR
jgi:Tfp pilus assembly protein PilV